MTYLALARKWRPRSFADVAGQPHVVRALENALGSGRVHHAFLFTGTRGVGKTTIARILVKALNCERGVSATPCGECASCLAIDAGRFVDFLELDAASRTGVDDTRELLDNAQYTPASGRYKVYLIDEVHMLSKAAFNALLKTLEEPPPHVKFLLATTDPQKIPVTVLSRCLQFNLKRLSRSVIAARVSEICTSEGLEAEPGAVKRLAEAARGSMRDALSLLDQALAYGDGRLSEAETAEMLGSLDRGRVAALLAQVAAGDARATMAEARRLDELSPDYDDVLSGLATLLQQVAILQLAGDEAVDPGEDHDVLRTLAGQMTPELVQLLYQIAVTGRRDLALAPDPRAGFEMSLLRMLAFRPVLTDERHPPQVRHEARSAAPAETDPPQVRREARSAAPDETDPAWERRKPRSAAPVTPEGTSSSATDAAGLDPCDWPSVVESLPLDGAARQLAAHTALLAASAGELKLGVERRNAHLVTEKLGSRVATVLRERFGAGIRVDFVVTEDPLEGAGTTTVAGRQARGDEEAMARARRAIEEDGNVRQLGELMGAEVVPDSVRPVSGTRRKR